MQFKVNPQLFKDYPGLTIGVVVVHDIKSNESTKVTQSQLKDAEQVAAKFLTVDTLRSHPYITAWHDAYRKFGAKPKKHLVSVENLIGRIIKDRQIRSTNALVDLYNVVSVKYMLPAGGEDLDTIVGDLELTYAGDDEQAAQLLGDAEPRTPVPGEVFYKDAKGAVCRRWNWKEAERTKIRKDSKNVILVLEALAVVDKKVLVNALYELAQLTQKVTGGVISVAMIDQDRPFVNLQKDGVYSVLDAPSYPEEYVTTEEIYALRPAAEIAEEQERKSFEHQTRLKKIEELRAQGIEPWAAVEPVSATCQQIIDEQSEKQDDTEYVIAGRLMTIRGHGKTAFCHLQDSSGKLQIYLKQEEVGEENFKFFKDFIDIGDIVWCKGKAFVTKMGELTLKLSEIKLLSKCLHPLPEKFHGIADIEIKYRQRYLDLISSSETRERFKKRSKIIRLLRDYLDDRGYEEVETPMLHPIPGGAAARPFVTHHNALDTDLYLRIAPELYLKRLVVGGIEKVYEINRNFRNEGVSTRHNPEFTMLEFYTAHRDYHYIMDFVEAMFKKVVHEVCGALQVPFGDTVINFDNFQRMSPYQAVVEFGGISEDELTPERIDVTCVEHDVPFDDNTSYNQKVFGLFEECAEANIIDPVFIVDFPIEISPLAKRDANDPAVAARFELFIAGMELGNGFNELNDPFDQASRFKDQAAAHASGDEEAMHYDAEYITALEYGMPPAVGVGIGIDRLTMILTDTISIKEVILFPAMKRK